MPRTAAFEAYTDRYEQWFERHEPVYRAELRAIRELLPSGGRMLEIGVGTGRFAAELGVGLGVEPCGQMARLALRRRVSAVGGRGEELPLAGGTCDALLMVTTLCFLDDAERAFAEALRVLRPGGRLVVGLVDLDTELGRAYERGRSSSAFYKEATFYTASQVAAALREAGFVDLAFRQTLFAPLDEITKDEPVRPGHGKGAFAAIAAAAPSS
ncbi:MAG: methyltransferase domain-containing protein [Polyangia bacterium]